MANISAAAPIASGEFRIGDVFSKTATLLSRNFLTFFVVAIVASLPRPAPKDTMFLRVEAKVDPIRLEVFYDAQTSGGLLISVEPGKADALVAALTKRNAAAAVIVGEVLPRGEAALVLRP